MRLEPISVGGRTFSVETIITPFKTMKGKVKGGTVIIEVPESWDRDYADASALKMRGRIERALSKNPDAFERERMPEFTDGQVVNAMGESFTVRIERTDRIRNASARLDNGMIAIRIPEGIGQEKEKDTVSRLILRVLSKALYYKFCARVELINSSEFKTGINAIRLKGITSRWGSCSLQNSLNFSSLLLLFPEEIIDSVIVHELAHTKVRRHSEKFWNIVYAAMPDYKARRKWLNRYQSVPLEKRPISYSPLQG
ncbi:MAG: YgjP-like metallopeptidase domain-containing protein [Candidatus Micrarchaeaceae archaeon]